MAFWRDDLKEFNIYILELGMHLNFQLTWSWSYLKTSMFDFTNLISDLNFHYVQCSIANKVKWTLILMTAYEIHRLWDYAISNLFSVLEV